MQLSFGPLENRRDFSAYCAMASDLLVVTIHGGSIEELQDIVRTRSYDFGCKPFTIPTEEGDYILLALLTRPQYDELTTAAMGVDIQFETS